MRLTSALLAGALLVLAAVAAPAATPLLLPGLGPDDRRVPVDGTTAPWSSLAKVQTGIGGRCTGALIGPRRVLTAAHCLFNPRTRRFLSAPSLHVLFGYDRGEFIEHAQVAEVVHAEAYDPLRPREEYAVDWAILVLAADAPPQAPPLLVAESVPPPGTAVVLGGYSQDKAQIITADTACMVLGTDRTARGPVLIHDCNGTRGTSGSPLLTLQDGEWRVVGVAVAGSTDRLTLNFAVPSTAFAAALR
ncbi:trypsin-like serine peptidase [Inquilinus limosus]|uniref:trypsin-like serine peptidase n=1 Tax=Inquilinus limosus TaxID=171674 RepID=UPI0004148466|nr:trypsin-like peptidase domain-containing protein [Inquilinus limosus]